MLNSRATRDADSRCRLQTPTTLTPGRAWNPGRCRVLAICPAPMMAIRKSPELIVRTVLSSPRPWPAGRTITLGSGLARLLGPAAGLYSRWERRVQVPLEKSCQADDSRPYKDPSCSLRP